MRNSSSASARGSSTSNPSESEGSFLGIPLPIQDGELFRHQATPYVLNFLADNPGFSLSIRQLSRVTPVTERATREAVDALEANDLVDVHYTGSARQVSVNEELLHRPEDPFDRIPQTEFRTPVRVACLYLEDELDGLLGVVLYGSVARGEADRMSDVDLWVLVDDDLAANRHRANEVRGDLEQIRVPPSIALEEPSGDAPGRWPEIRQQLEEEETEHPSAERYSFRFVVETPASIIGQHDSVDAGKLYGEGITLVSSDALDRVKHEVVRGD